MRTDLAIEADGRRSPRIAASGGLSARLTGPDTVHLIGTAATPLGGDVMYISIVVGAGARLAIHSVAASLALPGAVDRESFAHWSFEVGAGASLVFDPEPMIVAADAVHHTTSVLHFTSSSTIEFRERVQIGRAGERGGRWRATTHSDVDGRPHLRHRIELGEGSVGHDALAAPMALSSTLIFPDDRAADTDGRTRVRMPLAAGGSLTTSTAARLDALPVQS
ncbi:MAG: urease accessory protein UreD [Rhodococcus sp. (in: high G+C Gram-positive bacteria)]